MAVAVWAASTAFSVGDIRRASVEQPSGLFFRCSTAGTSASSEPGWPNMVGDTVRDGTCVWTAISAVYDELLKLNPSAIIELFEVRLDSALHGSSDIYRFHAGSNAKIDGNMFLTATHTLVFRSLLMDLSTQTPEHCPAQR